MLKISTVLETIIENGRRLIKTRLYGQSGGKESYETSPYGIDSNPGDNLRAIYAMTESKKSVVIGYINVDQISEVGGTRLFSEGSAIYLRKNGDIEIGGNTDNLISYSKLSTIMNTLATDINTNLISAAAGIASAGGAYSPSPISIDLSSSKLDKVKV